MLRYFSFVAAGFALFAAWPASAQDYGQLTVEGAVTAVADGKINGFVHCPIRKVTIEGVDLVWNCGGPLPEIGSVWRVSYFNSYPGAETSTARQMIPVNN